MEDGKESEPTVSEALSLEGPPDYQWLNKVTRSLVHAVIASGVGYFHYGYILFLIHNPAVLQLQFPKMEESGEKPFPKFLSLCNVIFQFGGLLGVLLFGFLADRYGRKPTLVITNGFSIIFIAIVSLVIIIRQPEFFIFARLIAIVGTGSFTSCIPPYILEISPLNLRGLFVTAFFLLFSWGFTLAQYLCLPHILGNKEGYPLLVGIAGVFSIISNILVCTCPESPRFLYIQRNDEAKARKVLQKLRCSEDMETEMDELREEEVAERSQRNMTWWRMLCFLSLRWHFITVLVLTTGYQFAGLGGVYNFVMRGIIKLGLPTEALYSIPLALNFLLQLVLLTMILTIETLGRRFLLLTSFLICILSEVLLIISLPLQINNPTMALISILFGILYIIGHMLGPAAIIILVIGELFCQSSRCSGYVLTGFGIWIADYASNLLFSKTEPFMGSYCLLFYCPILVAVYIYIFRMIPETKATTFLEIQKNLMLRINRWSQKTEAE